MTSDRGGGASPGQGVFRRARSLAATMLGLGLASVLLRVLVPAPSGRRVADAGSTPPPAPRQQPSAGDGSDGGDKAPGGPPSAGEEPSAGVGGYLLGLGFATLLTAASFAVARYGLVWKPGIPILLVVLAIAQMGIHLVFFLHITTGPENLNNSMALAFGILIVLLLMGGSIWIMGHLDQNMMPMGEIMKMQR